MAIRVDKTMRERIEARNLNIDSKYIYERDGEKIYRTLIEDHYCDVSGIKLDKPKEIDYISICKRLERIEDRLDILINRLL
jgi:hypothetical protein